MPTVYIILVNWNAWRHTIECLESVMRLNYSDYKVLVCDNSSSDASLDRIVEWANGKLQADSGNSKLRHLTTPPVAKPLAFATLATGDSPDLSRRQERLFLVPTGGNLGFAGANNVGMRIALSDKAAKYVWLLNNDTVVAPDSLTALIRRMEQRPDAGICGSTLLYYHEPAKVQALGGSLYNRWLARGHHIGLGADSSSAYSVDDIERNMRYVVGASMLVRREFLENVGLMDERYFLFAEEIDWATRAGTRYAMACATDSVVYHKEGGTTGSDLERSRRSVTSEYYSTRSRVFYTRRFFAPGLPSVTLAVLAGALLRFVAGNKAGAGALLRGLRDGWRMQ